MTIGENIKSMRRRCGMTQEELAAQLCVTAQAVSKWENGNGMPDITQLVTIAELLCRAAAAESFREYGRTPATAAEAFLEQAVQYTEGEARERLLRSEGYASAKACISKLNV